MTIGHSEASAAFT